MLQTNFYHIQNTDLNSTVLKLSLKAIQNNINGIIFSKDENKISIIDDYLWNSGRNNFIPHGTEKDGFPEDQPIFLTSKEIIPNDANLIMNIDGSDIDEDYLSNFEKYFVIFNGNNESELNSARSLWKKYKDYGFELSYWQEAAGGKWQKKL